MIGDISPWSPQRPRCICGALRNEPCRDHSGVIGYSFIEGKLQSVSNQQGVEWTRDSGEPLPSDMLPGYLESGAPLELDVVMGVPE